MSAVTIAAFFVAAGAFIAVAYWHGGMTGARRMAALWTPALIAIVMVFAACGLGLITIAGEPS